MAYSSPTPAQNKAALDYFVQMPVSHEMIAYLAQKATQVIRCEATPADRKNLPPTPPATPPQSSAQFARDQSLPSIESFITSLVERSHVMVPTLMSSLVYLDRLKSRLPQVAKGMRCTVHRIFLASLILAAKNLNDSSPKNKHWARYTAVRGYENFGFSITEVNLMEKQLLFLLDWDLRIQPEDLYFHLEPFLAPIRQQMAASAEQARQQRLREKEVLAQQQRSLYANVQAAVPRQNISQPPYSYPTAYSTPSSRAPSRTPSLSPPSRSSSSADSYPSSSPASSVESYTDSFTSEEPQIQRYDTESGATLVHIHGAPKYFPKAGHQLPLERLDEKPAKKAKTSGGILARFLSSTSYSSRGTAAY